MSQEVDFKDLPIEELWHNSAWKARQTGYDRVANDLEKGTASLPPAENLRSAVSDSNAIALDSGIKLLIAACRSIPEEDQRSGLAIRQAVAKPLAEKGLGASKPAAKQNALEALLVLVEVADPEGVVEDVLPVLNQRSPKLVAMGISALARIFGDFGSPVTDPRPVLTVLPGLFSHSDRSVRSAAMELAVSLYRWVGEPAMMQVLAQLKPVQLNELKAQFAKVNMSEPVKRLTRKQAAAAAAQSQVQQTAGEADTDMDGMALDGAAPGGAGDNKAVEIDPWDLATPRGIMSDINGEFWAGLQSSKWKERHEALLPLLQKLEKIPRLDPKSDYSQLVNEMLRIAAKDLNQLCATEAVQILTHLATGLRQSFQSNASRVLETVVERFKEKKPASIETVTKCIDALFLDVLAGTLQPVLEPLLRIGMVHKTPTVKLESTKYLAHLLRETPTAPSPQEIAEITPLAVKLMGDGSDPVRAAAANVLAALLKIAGQANMARALDSLDEHKKKRVAEAVEGTTVKVQTSKPQQPRPAVSQARPVGSGGPRLNQQRPAPSQQRGVPRTAPPNKPRDGSYQAPVPSLAAPRPPQQQQRQPPQQPPPQLRAPTTPAPSRGSAMRRLGANDDASHMSISSPSPPRSSPGSRPSVSSTPKIVKRSLAATEFTPARGVDPHRRRLHSPAKPADSMDDSEDVLSAGMAESARLKAELDLERKMRRDLETKLATTQVEHEREIRHLSEKVAALKVELQSAREDFAVELQHSRRTAAVDADDVRGRLNTLNLDEQALRAPQARERTRSPTARPSSMFGLPQRPRLVPIANQDNKTAVRPANGTEDRNRTGSEAWERAVTMTHDIRERVERLKARRQPDSIP